jgi:hypothetical protein
MDKIKLFFNRLSESGTSCLITMVQGNVLAITLGHWMVALKTGFTSSILYVFITSFLKEDLASNKYVMAGAVGFITAVADMLIHPSHFGGASTEAIVTGIGAGLLCFVLAKVGK